MIKVEKQANGNVLTVNFSGTIEETVNFDELVGATPAEVVVNTKEIARINSVGVKGWIKYFQTLTAKGVKLKFSECSTAIVEQINLISNFTCGGSVESVYVPFACGGCKTELVGLFKVEDLKKMNGDVPDQKCAKCGGNASFDDIPEEYFAFVQR